MIRKYLTLSAMVFASLLFALPVEADFIFGIDGSSTITSASSGTLTFFVEATAPDVNVHDVGGFTILYNTSASGGADLGDLTLSAPMSFSGGPSEYGSSLNPLVSPPLVSGSGAAGQILNTRFGLFTIDYSIAAGATELGQIDIGLSQTQLTNSNSAIIASGPPSGLSGATLSFNTSQVPEPSGMVLLLAGSGLVALRRRR